MTTNNIDTFKYFEQQEKDYVSLKQRALFDGEYRLIIDRDTPVVDECEKLMSLAGVDNDMICTNIFTLMCCCAGDSIKGWETMNLVAQYDTIAVNFENLYESMLIDSYFIDSLFKSPEFGSGPVKKWPAYFESYVSNKKSTTHTPTFKATNKATKAMTPVHLNHCYFGKQVADRYVEAKRVINNHANPLWIEPCKLQSGETVSGLLDTIRRGLYAIDVFSKCKKRLQSRNNKKKKEEKLSSEELSKAIVEASDDELNSLLNQPREHFPDWWLSFYLLSLPADIRCRKSFNTCTKLIDPQEALLFDSSMGSESGRAARRLRQRQIGSAKRNHLNSYGDEDKVVGSSTKKTKTSVKEELLRHQHTVHITKDEHPILQRKEVIEQQMDLVDKLIRTSSPETAAYYEGQRRQLYTALYEANHQFLFGSSNGPMDFTTPIRTHRQASPFTTQSDASSVHLGEDVSEFD
mmetsp:Transcript_13275/g.19993  ORF Transcript_13275/g.19993 Transcript_13275/m.19993 type:complete len:463 (+) Transcript_13275:120-1508(+)